mmetsp:Transcript_42377/g.116882  ORF Transcript_42377/g.116882 Transcript_42377/m.116882 type:complete len:248 (-) Transcript_42377:806-1549(-)
MPMRLTNACMEKRPGRHEAVATLRQEPPRPGQQWSKFLGVRKNPNGAAIPQIEWSGRGASSNHTGSRYNCRGRSRDSRISRSRNSSNCSSSTGSSSCSRRSSSSTCSSSCYNSNSSCFSFPHQPCQSQSWTPGRATLSEAPGQARWTRGVADPSCPSCALGAPPRRRRSSGSSSSPRRRPSAHVGRWGPTNGTCGTPSPQPCQWRSRSKVPTLLPHRRSATRRCNHLGCTHQWARAEAGAHAHRASR